MSATRPAEYPPVGNPGHATELDYMFVDIYIAMLSIYNNHIQMGEGLSTSDCISRWKTLRDKFVREVKKVKKRKSGDSGPPYASTWPLFSMMLFLADSIKHRP